jgi:beta-lactamase class A
VNDIDITLTEVKMNVSREAMHRNNTSPYAMSLLLQKFFKGEVVEKTYQGKLMYYMWVNYTSNERLKGALPKSTPVAHKTGTGSLDTTQLDACNDVGIIFLPNGQHLAVSVFVMNSKVSYESTEALIAKLSKELYDYYSK